MVRVLVLVVNTANKAGLLGEHGLAMWIESGDRRVLFDTGQGLALHHNARELGVSLNRADAIVLSHGHYDHTGGLAATLGCAPTAKVYAHPEAFRARYARNRDGTVRDVGIREADREAVQGNAVNLIETTQPTEVISGIFATGPVPRVTSYEHTSGPFFLDRECRCPDPLTDDQSLFFDTGKGIFVLLGCAHAGVVNTLEHIRHLTGGKPIYAVIGGMHLASASPERLEHTRKALREMDVQRVGPCHCTGFVATATLWKEFRERFMDVSVGTMVDI